MAIVNLSDSEWSLVGWRPFSWRLGRTRETGATFEPDIGPLPARVPGSVQHVLRDAGMLPDWLVGTNSRLCEWVEHRHWEYTTTLIAHGVGPTDRIGLHAYGLDYSGWMLVDNIEVARFTGAMIPHFIDLTESLGDGQEHSLSVVFEEPPREQGQIGYTSQSHHFKPRYSYSWDWCPRFVPIGIWDTLSLVTGPDADLEVRSMQSVLDEGGETGSIEAALLCNKESVRLYADTEVHIQILRDDAEIAHRVVPFAGAEMLLHLDVSGIEVWWPNGFGDQRLYTVEILIRDLKGVVLWHTSREIGFRQVEWRACEGAPAGAEPWICAINGTPVFLQGANWTPIRLDYPDTTDDEYRELIDLYRDMGATCLRVWGGGLLEREVFYNACDEAGILVLQELPLSSSGLENEPPTDTAAIAKLVDIGRTFIRRRTHHPSLLFWSGGNELTWSPGKPVDSRHPCIAALQTLIREEDPLRRFVATSPSGPLSGARSEDFGSGKCHDIHGPWGMGDMDGFQKWGEYWAADDALFRSEVGMPGAMDAKSIERYYGGLAPSPVPWPPEGDYWRHTASWWRQWDRLSEDMQGKSLVEYVERTQADQAEAYRIAAEACKTRFPRCGGFLIWMGHDCFPCPANNSVIDFDRHPKPAYYALQSVFRSTK